MPISRRGPNPASSPKAGTPTPPDAVMPISRRGPNPASSPKAGPHPRLVP
ncbi:MAG TPA: hypothetical protein VM142_05650 [Acidimicrobiales bacterium]|nr:hypothetical protein [Acidimicrobiales bacterium]